MDSRQRVASGEVADRNRRLLPLNRMEAKMIYILLLISYAVIFAAGAAWGYKKGYEYGVRFGGMLAMAEATRSARDMAFRISKKIVDDSTRRWGRFMGFTEEEIDKAQKKSQKIYEKNLN